MLRNDDSTDVRKTGLVVRYTNTINGFVSFVGLGQILKFLLSPWVSHNPKACTEKIPEQFHSLTKFSRDLL
jgi:hypothetical protein